MVASCSLLRVCSAVLWAACCSAMPLRVTSPCRVSALPAERCLRHGRLFAAVLHRACCSAVTVVRHTVARLSCTLHSTEPSLTWCSFVPRLCAGKLTVKGVNGRVILDPTTLSISSSSSKINVGTAANPHTLTVSDQRWWALWRQPTACLCAGSLLHSALVDPWPCCLLPWVIAWLSSLQAWRKPVQRPWA